MFAQRESRSLFYEMGFGAVFAHDFESRYRGSNPVKQGLQRILIANRTSARMNTLVPPSFVHNIALLSQLQRVQSSEEVT